MCRAGLLAVREQLDWQASNLARTKIVHLCRTRRKLCELVTAYVREILKSTAPELAGTIAVYRAGYRQAGPGRSLITHVRPLGRASD